MRGLRTGIIVLALLVVGAAVGFAQQASDTHDVSVTINALQAIEAQAATVSLLAVAATPGNPVTGGTPGTTDLYYTLLATDANNTITAALGTNFTTNSDWHVEVVATVAGDNSQGIAAAAQTLTTTSVTLISAIPSVATTRTNGTCPVLTYTLFIDDAAGLAPASETQTVTLTLTDVP